MAAFTCGESAGPSTTISTGCHEPARELAIEHGERLLGLEPSGSPFTLDTPVFMSMIGEAAKSRRTPTPTTSAMTGRRMTRSGRAAPRPTRGRSCGRR